MIKTSHRLNNMSYSKTLEMAAKARFLKNQGYDIINLSIGEPDFIPPKFILDSAKKAIDSNYHYYTPVSGIYNLKEAICKKFKRDNNLSYSTNQIVISNGAKQSIMNILLSIINPGDELIIPSPYWVSYYEMAKFCEATPIIINTELNNNFKITPNQLEDSITNKTKVFIFNSPSNPTGTVYSWNELNNIAQIIKKYPNIIIISDEIYEYINYSNKHISLASFPEIYNQTVVVNGISKSFSMTGWRIGYIGAPEWLAKSCDKIQGQTTSGANSIAQYTAITALETDPYDINYMVKAFKKRRDLIIKLIAKINGFKLVYPNGAFYVFPDISYFFGKRIYNNHIINNSEEFVDYILNKAHVAMVSGAAFGNKNCIRISYAISENKIKEAFNRIYKVI